MKKIFLILSLIIFCYTPLSAYSKDSSSSSWGENSDVFNKGFENQEAVSDKKFQKTLDMLKERSLTKKQKKIQAEVKPLSPSSDYEHLKDFAQSQSPDDDLSQTLTVMIPMSAYSEDGITIAPGYYKLSCRKIANNQYVLELSQGTTKVLTVNAIQTKQDLEQDSISFCNAQILDNGRIRLMYGSIDLNLVGYIYY
jgi:hypothetical protein